MVLYIGVCEFRRETWNEGYWWLQGKICNLETCSVACKSLGPFILSVKTRWKKLVCFITATSLRRYYVDVILFTFNRLVLRFLTGFQQRNCRVFCHRCSRKVPTTRPGGQTTCWWYADQNRFYCCNPLISCNLVLISFTSLCTVFQCEQCQARINDSIFSGIPFHFGLPFPVPAVVFCIKFQICRQTTLAARTAIDLKKNAG